MTQCNVPVLSHSIHACMQCSWQVLLHMLKVQMKICLSVYQLQSHENTCLQLNEWNDVSQESLSPTIIYTHICKQSGNMLRRKKSQNLLSYEGISWPKSCYVYPLKNNYNLYIVGEQIKWFLTSHYFMQVLLKLCKGISQFKQ